jgi:GNAT superfamily N-acetyltransferase
MTDSPVLIRRATPADASDVAAMVREIAAHEDQSAHVHVSDTHWHSLLERPDVLYVRPGHRDAGIGRRLMAALAGLAAPEQLLIRWGMEVDNIDAQRFYRRLGATLRPKILAAWSPTAYGSLA